MSRSFDSNINPDALLSVTSDLYHYPSVSLQFFLELNIHIPPYVFRKIIRSVGILVRLPPRFVKTLVRRLISLPNSQSSSGKNRFAGVVVRRILKKIESPPPVFSRNCLEEDLNLGQFSYVIASRFVPFLRGNMSLSLTQIFEILCFLIYHLKKARSKMQDFMQILNIDGRFDDERYNEQSVKYNEFKSAKDIIKLVNLFLEYFEPAMPTCQGIFEHYMQEMLSIFPRMLGK